jgi:hypothetical protein
VVSRFTPNLPLSAFEATKRNRVTSAAQSIIIMIAS